MKRLRNWFLTFLLAALLEMACAVTGNAQSPPLNSVSFYTLVNGSQLTDDCPICDRLTAPVPMRGTFQIRFLGQGPLFANYAVENVSFTGGQTGSHTYKVSGHGTYRIGGEVGVQQDLFLEVMIDDGITNKLCELTNVAPLITRRWPMLHAEVAQTNGTLSQQYSLAMNAAPFREIWFSTATNFQATVWNAPSNSISDGDLLSSVGGVVKRNNELTARLGIQPAVPDLGLKDIDILPGGEITFSIEQSVFSASLGQILPQDLLSDGGRILYHANPDLIGNFQPIPPLPQLLALEAVQVMDNGEVYFSVQNGFESAKLGLTVHPGDLLSNNGTIIRHGPELLAAFNPANPTNDYGLKAIYMWSSSEIWFATRDGFYDTKGAFFSPGDLLSDQGYVVYTNAELLSAFAPFTSPADLGLDALFVVSDITPTISAVSLGIPQETNQPPASLFLQRSKGNRVFQLEAATNAIGPFLPISPITTDTIFVDAGVLTNQMQRFYRLHQW